MPTLEQVQAKVRSRISAAPAVRKLEWQRISQQVLRADDYEVRRSGAPGHFIYELVKTPFGEVLWGPCETAQEAMECASLHQVLL